MNMKKTQQENGMDMDAEESEISEAESEGGAVESEDVEQLKTELSTAKAEAADTYDRLLRLSAEFENYKKRVQRQMEDHKKYANEDLIKDLLSVVDNLERALNAAGEQQKDETGTCMAEGVEMTLNEIVKILKNHNVTPIEAKGKPFDPTYHEAVMQEETDDYPENTVISEFQKGYMLHDRLIRPAMVTVAKQKTA
ncbi:MAG: nucleotide exchange factor GrpE [Desulfobacteraceae bacterium]|nr:nucleotide exchange factor GrpE [Desulfobacteraceae bacterium]